MWAKMRSSVLSLIREWYTGQFGWRLCTLEVARVGRSLGSLALRDGRFSFCGALFYVLIRYFNDYIS